MSEAPDIRRRMPDGRRLVFANQLRGAAACMVLAAHYTVVVQMMRPAVSWVVGAPPLEGPVPGVAGWVAASPVDPGALAVAVFFLISGFVIPFSLERLGPWRFLVARAWRILPVFWVALALGAAMAGASGAYWGRELPYRLWPDYAVNGLLLESWAGRPTVDWVSWTLSVEVKFYVLAALCRAWVLARPVGLALAWGVAALGVNLAVTSADFASEAAFLPFMLIGAMFHAHLAGRLGGWRLAGGAAAVLAVAALCWRCGPSPGETAARGVSLLAGCVLFGGCYALRRRFRPNRVLDGLAAISYPLYLVHSLAGFPVLSFLMLAWRVPYGAAVGATLGWVVGVAALLHWLVERPANRLGHRLARGRVAATA